VKSDFEILAFLNSVVFFENQKSQTKALFIAFFPSERLDADKALSELHILYKSLLTSFYDHAWCKQHWEGFSAALKMLNVFNKKQMYVRVITGKMLLKIAIVLHRSF